MKDNASNQNQERIGDTLIVVGYVVVQWRIGLVAEFVMLSLLGFETTLLIYELLVRRTKVTRFLFGMKG